MRQIDLRIAKQHGQLGAREAFPVASQRPNFLVRRKKFHVALERGFAFELAHEAGGGIEIARGGQFGDRQRQCLIVIVLEHETRHVFGHGGEHRQAVGGRQFAAPQRSAHQDLDIDLVVRGVDAGRIVDGVGVDASAFRFGTTFARIFDAAELRDAEIGAFPDDFRFHIAPVHAQRIAGAVAGIGVTLRGRFDEGADAAKEEQIDFGAQQRTDEFGGCHPVLGDAA